MKKSSFKGHFEIKDACTYTGIHFPFSVHPLNVRKKGRQITQNFLEPSKGLWNQFSLPTYLLVGGVRAEDEAVHGVVLALGPRHVRQPLRSQGGPLQRVRHHL